MAILKSPACEADGITKPAAEGGRAVRFRALGCIAGTAAAVALAGSSALAADPAKPPEKAPNAGKPDPKTMHCVAETPTGTFIPKRVCYSQEDWAELQRLAAESHQRDQDQRTFCTRGGREC
jgi:hypothetical protein